MPAVRPDRVSIGPLHATVLDLVGKPEHRGDAGERGRRCGRQLPRTFRLSDEFMATLDAWSARQDDAPTRSEAIRRLVELGLKAKAK